MASLGQVYDFYVSATSPAAPSTIANYTAVAEVTDLDDQSTAEFINTASFDSGAVRTGLVGQLAPTITGTAHFDVGVDAGQAVIQNAHKNRTLLYFLFFPTDGTTGDELVYGSGYVTRRGKSYRVNQVISFTFTVEVVSRTDGTKA